MAPVVLSESEFEALPPKLKRQYFSSVERLRYAQAHAQSYRPQSSSKSSFHSQGHAVLSKQPLARTVTAPAHSDRDAFWWSQLPQKIKRGHFSIEEQRAFEAQYEHRVFDVGDRALYRLGQQANRSLPSLQHTASTRSIDEDELHEADDEADCYSDMDANSMHEGFDWFENDLDLSLNDYHVHLVRSAAASPAALTRQAQRHRRRFSRRGQSFSKIESPSSVENTIHEQAPFTTRSARPSLEAGRGSAWSESSLPPIPKVPSIRKNSTSKPSMALPPHAPFIDPEVVHYQDPEVRLKLRLYLTSPQKFDEAIEFGFPSLHDTTMKTTSTSSIPSFAPSTQLSRPPTSRRTNKRQPDLISTSVPTKLPDQVTALIDDDPWALPMIPAGDDASSFADDNDLPLTPTSPTDTFPHHAMKVPASSTTYLPKPSSMDKKRPTILHSFSEPPFTTNNNSHFTSAAHAATMVSAWPGNREMTLRMTLTRPDLRADESLLYPDAIYKGVRGDGVRKGDSHEADVMDRPAFDALLLENGIADVEEDVKPQKMLRRLLSRVGWKN